jgi:hypothetical protein
MSLLGSKLSPKLRKTIFKTAGDAIVRCLIEFAPGADQEALSRALTSLGAEIRTRSEDAHLLTIDIPVSRLAELDTLKGIVYVEADERYRR